MMYVPPSLKLPPATHNETVTCGAPNAMVSPAPENVERLAAAPALVVDARARQRRGRGRIRPADVGA